MQTELIKLKIKKECAIGIGAEMIELAFIEACKKLDASLFEPLISEDIFFEEKDKYQFLASLQQEFNHWKQKDYMETKMVEGKCLACHFGHKMYEFHAQKLEGRLIVTRRLFGYIIHKESNEIQDIFMCNASTSE